MCPLPRYWREILGTRYNTWYVNNITCRLRNMRTEHVTLYTRAIQQVLLMNAE